MATLDYPREDEGRVIKSEQTIIDSLMVSHKIISELEEILNCSIPRNGEKTEPFGKIALITDMVEMMNTRLLDIRKQLTKL